MKNLYLICFALLSITSLMAQDLQDDWTHSAGTLEGFLPGNKYYTLVTDANLREKPGTQSNVLTKLPIGTQVTVEEVTTDSFMLRGVKMPWLKVRCQPAGAATVSGYIWAGFMALAYIQTPDEEYALNRGVLYLTGVAAYNEATHQLTVQVRIALAGKELSKAEFTTGGDIFYYPEFTLHFEPFNKVKAVLSVNYAFPACGYVSGDNLLFWQENNQLIKVLETNSVSEAGLFYESEEYLLPSQRGGIGDHVLVIKDSSSFEEKGDDLARTKQTYAITIYKWNGSKLVKVKEMK